MRCFVETRNPKTGDKFWLKGSTWAFSRERAQIFDTREAAQAQLEKSKKFNQPWAFKAAIIVDDT